MDGKKFDGQPVTEELLDTNGYRKYSGKEIDIYYNKDICIHAGECVRGNSAVYEVGRRPWIIADNAVVDEQVQIIAKCPSGALKYIRKDVE
ncbi:hypothetical protein BAU15_04175 [Enterococcus sp. JM4C]|uniref:(4Fe-4S)-binding protein n=1 Tax=Candidatus Enterococcus huntleyi TaxID=1857217 RepID=UPI001379C752|nr:(4Fe-4S)-binding protein [Enterococcus sp. JM4C]KAF1295740.1 hypothetical protein BAU15_04175 [Enterococcus sp. JM4C]